MAEKLAQDRAAKGRIITHMNNDHHDSVIRYLQYYGKCSSYTAYSGRVTDIDLTGLTLTCQAKTIRIPFEPPMTSYSQARERVVELDKHCTKALGLSDVAVRKYAPPSGFALVVFVAVISTFIGYSQRWWFAPGGPVEQVLGAAFARFSWRIQPWLLGGLCLVHGAEAAYFAATKLPAHSVNVRDSIWWLWTGSTFIEGVFATMRFNRLVKAQREKSKH